MRLAAGLAVLGAATLGAQPVATAAAAKEAASANSSAAVIITVSNLRSAKGVVIACMTTKETIFPKCREDPSAHRTVVKANGGSAKGLTIRFDDVKPGDYAIALLHDENNDGKANRAMGMMPREGFGFSRDAKVRMGPPKFRDAVFTHGAADQALTISMRYFL
ncbi:MAG: DUF2141 domain-containing protein [Erythrobacter sp.]|jgi:uncharacterized protein (DUF2141 family)|nr:DUF2141 domain-containing protein [Erythrobacter sp.]